MLTDIFAAIRDTGKTKNREVLIGSGIALTYIAKTMLNIITISDFFKLWSDEFRIYGSLVLQNTENDIQLLISQNFPTPETIKSLESASKTIYHFVNSITNLLQKAVEFNCTSAIVSLISTKDGIITILSKLLMVPIQFEGQESIFFIDPNTQARILLNESKASILTSFGHVIQFVLLKNPPKKNPREMDFFISLKQNSPFIISSIYNAFKTFGAQQKSIKTNSMDEFSLVNRMLESLEECLISGLLFISKTATIPDFYEMYMPIYHEFFKEVLLQNLLLSEEEAENFAENEVEFVEYSKDVCFKQKSKTIKTYSMRIVEVFCQKLDGALSHIAGVSLSLIDSILSKANEQDTLKNYPMLETLVNSSFLQNNTQEKVLDVCLLIITSLCALISKRADLT
jgi:hypothetical protein